MELIGNRSQVAKAWVCKTSIRRFESDRFLQRHSTHHFFTWLVDRTGAPDQRFKAENSSETFFLQIPVSFIYTYNIHAGRSPPLSVHTFQLSPPRSIYLLRLSFHSEVYVYGSTAPGSERLMLDLNALTRWWGPMEESRGGGRATRTNERDNRTKYAIVNIHRLKNKAFSSLSPFPAWPISID